MTPTRASLLVTYICAGLYLGLLSESGIAERMRLEKELSNLNAEVERLVVENQGLEEKERRLKNDVYALEQEARKYYLLSETAHVLKFEETHSPGKEKPKVIPTNLRTAGLSGEWKEPPLFLLRFFFISFSVFLVLGVYFKLKRLQPMSNHKRLN
ncbi:septum formation initiator family protein [Leptospira bandrabouensis]|uniref:Septum formation initiator n=1 Tax=Leptospira bandrabouensis TaxID=2484903 RepID=A0A6H3NPH1_9LEPT|nr:septum formation initiator family protein [Leptospira bandrabouensis]MCG6144616.1 septum formation initiator family protein [Leptospira bandrabouensis]MCG6161832.1 septum formation initiator family protein [Leptospira bandrabouensis]MCG6164679.1 septum formation initiator family protein [Leptospira bandrabouensis]MCW7459474.1 septum formation initiator family protein [Leptospira bandrabouensis]MCW7477859.1 septum formation initiator family protein [Leptospira bandrabouensis]